MKLYDITSGLYLYLVTFRRRARKGLPVTLDEVRAELDRRLAEAEGAVLAQPGLAPMWEKAKYALAVFADEVALDSEWSGREAWASDLLEQKLFGTSLGGMRFYELLEELTPTEADLAEIFYLCLSLGFRGRYMEGAPELETYKRKLFHMLPGRISPDETRITPEAYYAVEGEAKGSPLLNLARVAVACGAFAIVYFAFSQVLFHFSVSSIHEVAQALTR